MLDDVDEWPAAAARAPQAWIPDQDQSVKARDAVEQRVQCFLGKHRALVDNYRTCCTNPIVVRPVVASGLAVVAVDADEKLRECLRCAAWCAADRMLHPDTCLAGGRE